MVNMTPVGWWNGRLVCEGEDGRLYLRRHVTWFTRWLYRKLPDISDEIG